MIGVIDMTDPDVALRYITALIQMIDMLLFRKSTSEQYELTNNGWQTASKIGR